MLGKINFFLMQFWKDKEQRKATIQSVLIHLLLTLLFAFFGLKYLDPKPEEGISIAFGFDAMAGGEQIEAPIQQEMSAPVSPSQTDVSEATTEYTQDVVDAPALERNRNREQRENRVDEVRERVEPVETPPTETPPTLDPRLRSLQNNPNPSQTGSGSGTNQGDGQEGREDGRDDRGSSAGGGGTGTSDNYRLGNRRAISKPSPNYDCQEEGRVVVRIRVDRTGKVVSADAGVNIPGGETSTTTSNCLREKARQAAIQTTWQSASRSDDPDLQMGYIIYNFRKN